jgi:predicted ATPase
MTESAKPRRKPKIMANDLGEQVALYSVEGRAVHVLNPTAHLIWDLCDGEHSLEDIEVAIRSSFAVPEGHDVQAYIRRTVEELSRKRLLTP